MNYEVYAVKYAHHARRASENFIGGDPHDAPMPLDYFVWLVRGGGREIVVDTGFSAAMAVKRGRDHIRCPTEGLRLLQCDSSSVKVGGCLRHEVSQVRWSVDEPGALSPL